jgi:hypothetical protein
MTVEKSKIAQLRKSREGQFLTFSAAVSLMLRFVEDQLLQIVVRGLASEPPGKQPERLVASIRRPAKT